MHIITRRLKIRDFTEADIDSLFELLNDPEVMKFCFGSLDYEQSQKWLSSIMRYYREIGYDYWLVEDKDSGEFIGQAGIIQQKVNDRDVPCLAYMIKKDKWGQGYASECAQACVRYTLETLTLKELYATVDKKNIRSKNILKKVGMEYVGDVMCYGENVELYVLPGRE